ncbi:Roundabout 2, partial [Ataeniobius toweri]|nr:Roundabout 2 [Ataeniobius toweri]
VENPSQFIQGYRVLYRQTSGLPSPGPWQIQDMRIASERDVTLAGLNKGIVYEIKVRPYFNEFQGADSESMTARTMEEVATGKSFMDNGISSAPTHPHLLVLCYIPCV